MSDLFDPDYATLPDFILGITERIWEGRDLGLIRRTYAADVAMHTGAGTSVGVESVVAGTLAALHIFPDRRLLPEDVIWSGGAAGDGYSSHRIASTMHHRGDGMFGPPTGRPVLVRTIADCLIRRGTRGEARIVEEWLVRDQSAIALQLGLEPRALGARLAEANPDDPAHGHPPGWDEVRRAELPGGGDDGGDLGYVADEDGGGWDGDGGRPEGGEGLACAAAMARIWNDTDLSAIRTHYASAAALHLPGGVVAAGHAAMDALVVGLLAAFPDARLRVDHRIVRREPGQPVRVALRWRLAGTHSGPGAFGPPSNARVVILGITHAELVGGRVTREFVMVDELAIWTAIAAARG